jgi:hypothetical protein
MELIIKRVENGYISSFEDEQWGEIHLVFEDAETEHGEIECFQRLLYHITTYFDMIGSDYDTRRIRITIGGEDEL